MLANLLWYTNGVLCGYDFPTSPYRFHVCSNSIIILKKDYSIKIRSKPPTPGQYRAGVQEGKYSSSLAWYDYFCPSGFNGVASNGIMSIYVRRLREVQGASRAVQRGACDRVTDDAENWERRTVKDGTFLTSSSTAHPSFQYPSTFEEYGYHSRTVREGRLDTM